MAGAEPSVGSYNHGSQQQQVAKQRWAARTPLPLRRAGQKCRPDKTLRPTFSAMIRLFAGGDELVLPWCWTSACGVEGEDAMEP